MMKRRVSVAPSGAGLAGLHANAISNGKEAVRIHEEHTRGVIKQLIALKSSLSDLSKVMIDVSEAFESYSSVFHNTSEPEVLLAQTGSDKVHDILGRYIVLLNDSIREFDKKLIDPFSSVETKINVAKGCLHKYSDAYETRERARLNVEQQSKKKNNTALIVKAQEEESAALRDCSKAQKETIAAQCQAVAIANKQCVDSFDGFFTVLTSFFRRGNGILSDMEAFHKDMLRDKESILNALTSSQNEPESESVITEQLEELTASERKFITLLSALEAVAQNFADQGLPHCPQKDIDNIVGSLKALQEVHESFKDAIILAVDASDKGQAIIDAVSKNYATFELAYFGYLDHLPYFSALLDKFNQAKGFKPVRKLFDHSCRDTGLTNDDIQSVFSSPCRHPSVIQSCLKTIVKQVSVTSSTTDSWFAVYDRWESFCNDLDKAKNCSDHMQELVRLQDTLLGIPDLVTKSRIFQYDSDVTCFDVSNSRVRETSPASDRVAPVSPSSSSAQGTSTGSDAASVKSGSSFDNDGQPSPSIASGRSFGSLGSSSGAKLKKSISMLALAELQQQGNSPQKGSPQANNDLEIGMKYRMFLFNDIIVFARPSVKKVHGALAGEKTYTICQRYLTRHLTLIPETEVGVQDDEKKDQFVFGMRHPNGSFLLNVSSLDSKMMWRAYLDRIITERNKNYVFGVPLEQLMSTREDNSRDVPPVLMDAALYVRKNCVGAEGLFRLSSSTSDLERARDEIDNGLTPKYNDVYIAANIIKLWLRSLPEPLMTYELYDQWIAVKDDPNGLQEVLTHLPFVNRFVLCEIMNLLSFAEKHKETTKMNASNLAIVMTPNLLYKNKTAGFSAEPQEVVETLILNYSTVFQDTEALRERQRTERVSARHGRRLRSQATSKSLADKGSVKERRIAPTALALKAEFKLAAPQDIGPPPPPVDIPPPPPPAETKSENVPDIGPPADIPPPLMVPASPVRGSGTGESGVLPGFSQSLIPPPPALSPVVDEDIPPPPVANAKAGNVVLLGDPGKSESGTSSSKKHSRHKSSSGTTSLDKHGEEKKKKKKHHKEKSGSSSKGGRDRGESMAATSSESKPEDDGDVEGARVRAVSEWSVSANFASQQGKEQGKSMSSVATPGESLVGSDSVSQSSEHQSVDASDTPRCDDAP